MKNKIKILFFGTPEFAAIVLEKMIGADYKPTAVITMPDKPVGRKQIFTPSPTKLIATKYNIPVLQPEVLSISNFQFPIFNPDLIVLAAFGQLIPKEILEIPKYGCLNIHPSLLPKYRGASPIQTAILNGDEETGVTIMLMDKLLDHGNVIANSKFEIRNSKITAKELTNDLAELGAELLIKTIPKWINKEIKAQPQDDSQATFTKIIKKEDGQINWQKSAQEIERMVRAYSGWPGTYTEFRIKNIEYRKLKILKAEILITENEAPHNERNSPKPSTLLRQGYGGFSAPPSSQQAKKYSATENKKEPGVVFLTEKKELAVACGPVRHASLQGVTGKQDALILEEVQLEGKNVIDGKSFLNGYPAIIGSVLR